MVKIHWSNQDSVMLPVWPTDGRTPHGLKNNVALEHPNYDGKSCSKFGYIPLSGLLYSVIRRGSPFQNNLKGLDPSSKKGLHL